MRSLVFVSDGTFGPSLRYAGGRAQQSFFDKEKVLLFANSLITHKRAVYELACQVGEEHKMDVRDIQDACSLMAEEQDHENVIFQCADLVDVDTCDVPCDWEIATHACDHFTPDNFEGTRHLIVHDLDSEKDYSADSNPGHYATTTPSFQDEAAAKTICSVIGCNTVHKETAAKHSFAFPPTKSCKRYKNSTRVEHICKFHVNRRMRKHTLWTQDELEHDPTRRCGTHTSDPGSCTLGFKFSDADMPRKDYVT